MVSKEIFENPFLTPSLNEDELKNMINNYSKNINRT